jgi:hypothetical protein
MTTSPATSTLSKPIGDARVPDGTLAYFRGRNRFRLYEIIVKEFLKSDRTQATLARRLGRRPEVVNRVLSAPANLTIDTVSDFLFAISGAEPAYGLQYPLDQAPRNYGSPEWLSHSTHSLTTTSAGVSTTWEWEGITRNPSGGTNTIVTRMTIG